MTGGVSIWTAVANAGAEPAVSGASAMGESEGAVHANGSEGASEGGSAARRRGDVLKRPHRSETTKLKGGIVRE